MAEVRLSDYLYELPADRIAQVPLPQRDQSKLLFYRQGRITHHSFAGLPQLLPAGATLVFNDTKVIPARLIFHKDTGAEVEVFLLRPLNPFTDPSRAMDSTSPVMWECLIGNVKRWKSAAVLHLASPDFDLKATLLDRQKGSVEFSWDPAELAFSRVLQEAGDIPLPPYIRRKPNPADAESYQTTYSANPGAVAAPTAGLHFTRKTFSDLKRLGLKKEFLTLHVSAGTFLPVQSEKAAAHRMHAEQLSVSRKTLEHLREAKSLIAVGTTSLRLLESLYWWAVKLGTDPDAGFVIGQEDPQKLSPDRLRRFEALDRVIEYARRNRLREVRGETSLYVLPGYTFRMADGLVTNFHQPGSTLILLVAAFVGPRWRNIYEEALRNGYRFLSYGDSSLLLP